jgi:hypothetical protein
MKGHTALGPGLLESAYQRCLAYELTKMRKCKPGFILNWNVPRMKDGVKRMVNHL